MKSNLDRVEILLTTLLCAEGDDYKRMIDTSGAQNRNDLSYEKIDAGSVLNFAPRFPRLSYTFIPEKDYGDRLIANDASLLLKTPQEIIGEGVEVSLFADDCVKWMALIPLKRPPKRVWIGAPRASLYEAHFRKIYPTGDSTYQVGVGAVTSTGRPVPTAIVGSQGVGSLQNSQNIVWNASVVEDSHRAGVLTATVTDATSIRFPVAVGDHKELFALRDAPLTASGRRKAIVHWVAKHSRALDKSIVSVRPHWRGVRSLEIDGMTVSLQTND